jgi:hypothetical protein
LKNLALRKDKNQYITKQGRFTRQYQNAPEKIAPLPLGTTLNRLGSTAI